MKLTPEDSSSWPPILAARRNIIDTLIRLRDSIPVIEDQVVPLKHLESLVNLKTKNLFRAFCDSEEFSTHNILWRVLFPGKYPGRLVVESQRVVGAGVSADIVLIVRLQDQVGAGATEEVDLEFPRRAQGIHGLGPAAYVTDGPVGVDADVVHADVVDALLEGAVLGAGAGVALGDKGHGRLPRLVPVARVLHAEEQLVSNLGAPWRQEMYSLTLSTSNGVTTGGVGGHGPGSQKSQ